MKVKFLSILLIALSSIVFAQEKTLLETLVKNGTISEEEATQIAKDRVVVTPSKPEAKVLTIGGGIDVWYTWSSVETGVTNLNADTNGFDIRYVKIDINAEILGGWQVNLVTDFGVEGRRRNYLDKVVVSKKFDYDALSGELSFGMRKVNMGYEQNVDDFALQTIERSVATWFFTRPEVGRGVKNFGSRAVGIFWDGKLPQVEGLKYGFAVVGGNSFEGSSASLANYDGNNNLSIYLNAAYSRSEIVNDRELKYTFGLNYGYSNGAYVVGTKKNEMWGVNPYLNVSYRGASATLEYFLQGVENGNWSSAEKATPQGFNATIAYRFSIGALGELEPVFRVSIVSTDGMGMNPLAINPYESVPRLGGGLYNFAQTYYFGANWYIIDCVRVGLGFEWGQFSKPVNVEADENGDVTSTMVRASLQVLF